MTSGCYTYRFELEDKQVSVILAGKEYLDIIDIESLAQIEHRARREWAIYLIQCLTAGVTETISLESLVDLRTNPFNIRLLQEGWVQGRFTLVLYDTDINLFIHQVRKILRLYSSNNFSLNESHLREKQPSICEVFILKPEGKVLWFLIVRNTIKIRILVLKFSVAATRLQRHDHETRRLLLHQPYKINHNCNL